jgi:hypothetical protein
LVRPSPPIVSASLNTFAFKYLLSYYGTLPLKFFYSQTQSVTFFNIDYAIRGGSAAAVVAVSIFGSQDPVVFSSFKK